jgi:uncharacterized protein (DUF885 family)
MRKIYWLLLIVSFSTLPSVAQKKKKQQESIVDKTLKEIQAFRKNESRQDSINGHWLGSNNEEDFLRRYNFYNSVYTKLNAVNKTAFSFDDLVNLELLQYSLEDEISDYEYKTYLNPILSDEGFHTQLASMGSRVFGTKNDAQDYIRQMRDIPRYVDENLALMRKGVSLGISQPRSILNGYENTYEQHIVDDVTKSVFWKPFLQKPFAINDTDWIKLKEQAANAISQDVIESFRKIKSFFDNEYLPKTRTTIGVSNFPNGLAFYQERVHHYTTTDLTFEEVYQLGLKEVARIKKEMMTVIKEANFPGTMQDFIAYLRTEPRFYVTTPEQLLKEASFLAKQIDGKLPSLFTKLPRQPYGVEPVPAYLAPTYTAGRYSGASINSKRAGHYWVNTYDLKSRPLYALPSLTLHEAVPGHHLQIALTQELNNLPDFRRNLYVNAFGEGWGLYAEYLGEEMGFYKDPYVHFGRLTYEMWRACRLVLDVALHTKGWTREQAVNYLAENTALSLREVNTEINRYISWPGQALAYKMGELKIKELRKRAEDRLKEKFDVREFHDLILSQGTVTLKIMDMMVERWLATKK